jgi:hypothetical protein
LLDADTFERRVRAADNVARCCLANMKQHPGRTNANGSMKGSEGRSKGTRISENDNLPITEPRNFGNTDDHEVIKNK